jgi:hypothetical protein
MSDNNTAAADEPVWKTVNKTARELLSAGLFKIEEFVKAEPGMAAQKLYMLAQENDSLRHMLRSEAWSAYYQHRAAWLETYNAVITGAYAHGTRAPTASCQARTEADELHGPLPKRPE